MISVSVRKVSRYSLPRNVFSRKEISCQNSVLIAKYSLRFCEELNETIVMKMLTIIVSMVCINFCLVANIETILIVHFFFSSCRCYSDDAFTVKFARSLCNCSFIRGFLLSHIRRDSRLQASSCYEQISCANKVSNCDSM